MLIVIVIPVESISIGINARLAGEMGCLVNESISNAGSALFESREERHGLGVVMGQVRHGREGLSI